MVRIERFGGYSAAMGIAEEFVAAVPAAMVAESGGVRDVLSKILADLKVNAGVIMSFGTGLEVMMPLVRRLVQNGELKVDLNVENAVLLTLTALTIAYLQEEREEAARRMLDRDSRSLLEELKLRGVGNGIVKKVVGCIKAVGALARVLMKHRGHVLSSFFEMLGYTALCVPVIGAIKSVVNMHGLTLDTFPQNMASLALGLGSLGMKQGVEYIRGLADRSRRGGGTKMINEQ